MMLRIAKGFALTCGLAAASTAWATILPPNDLHLQDHNRDLDSNITEAQFNAIIDEAEEAYTPIIKAHGGKLVVKRLWDNSTVNASAIQTGSTWTVNMYGGLARRPEVTPDAFALVLCHEIGHHLGGFPYVSDWAANEGQSDYFGALSCARLLWKDQLAKNEAAAQTIDSGAKRLCDSAWASDSDRNLCYRTMMASRSLATLLANGKRVSFATPDKNKVKKTDHSHPAGQCRLDTFMAGALCQNNFDTGVIPSNESSAYKNSCGASFEIGRRPRCWFKPAVGDY